MRSISYFSTGALLAGVVTSAGLSAGASTTPIELLPVGDSITFGVGTDSGDTIDYGPFPVDQFGDPVNPDDDLGGYRFYLDMLLSPDFDFVGNRSQGDGISGVVGFSDNQGFGEPGAQATNVNPFNGGTPSILTAVDNIAPGNSSTNALFDPSVTKPDAVLLHIGINSIFRDSFIVDTGDNAADLESTIQSAVGELETLLKGDSRTGLVERLTDTSYFEEDAHLFIALINPRADGKDNANSARFITQLQPNTVGDYNSRVRDLIESEAVPGGDLEDLQGRYTFVDLFSIAISELDTQALADEFYGGNLSDLLAAINPEDEGDAGIDDDYVDWVYNPSFDFDEGEYDNGEYDGSIQLMSQTRDVNYNTALLPDGLHPSNLGAAINAQVWANAINSSGIPEPGSLVLLAAGGAMLLTRRRRSLNNA
ncbi:MAG: PEP-CTERM sorting domain-containing protein [Planctomycetota bacterium]